MKQFFSPLAEPLAMLWLLMALGVLWLVLRRQWRSAIWLGIPTALLFFLGSTSIAESLVAIEEKRWAAGGKGKAEMLKTETQELAGTEVRSDPETDPLTVDAVVALGGGHRISRYDALGFAVYDGGSRLLTAIELARSGRAKTLVLGGSWPHPDNNHLPSMDVIQAWVVSWGLVNCSVTNLGICMTTHDEAMAFTNLNNQQGWKSVLLVTSAMHMRRAVALFRKQGIEVVPFAADFEVYGVSQELPFSPFPRQHRFALLALYFHEKVGWWVYRWRGWV